MLVTKGDLGRMMLKLRLGAGRRLVQVARAMILRINLIMVRVA